MIIRRVRYVNLTLFYRCMKFLGKIRKMVLSQNTRSFLWKIGNLWSVWFWLIDVMWLDMDIQKKN
jgi:hypothetical protein